MFEQLTWLLDKFLELGIPGVDCVVYQHGQCVYRNTKGYSDRELKTPLTGRERYNLYSCSKPITCAAALRLYETGAFHLDDPLYLYLPEYRTMKVRTEDGVRPAKNVITVRDLFCMTAGLNYSMYDSLKQAQRETNGRCPTRETIRYLSQEPLDFEPGTRWQYSLCHDVLAAMVEEISDMRFGEYVRQNIFEPLGMSQSSYNVPESEFDQLASQYAYNAETSTIDKVGKAPVSYKYGSEYEGGGATCVSSVEDYVRFMEAMREDGRILKRETVKMMSTNQLNDACLKSYTSGTDYGYGLGVRCPYRNPEVFDFGWGGAAGSYMGIDLEHEVTFFHAQHVWSYPNRSGVSEYRRDQVGQYVTQAILGGK